MPSSRPTFLNAEMTSVHATPVALGPVVVAMSGGVDSSVVAGLLKAEGRDVVGITLQLYDHGAAAGRRGACCAGQDIRDARRVADQLQIPHYVLDYEQRFAERVIAPFAGGYLSGETPIPCVACNQEIKFKDLLETARSLGAASLATGHYIEKRALPGGRAALHRAADTGRDQSYFLFATTPDQLAGLEFPLGAMGKSEVRALARRLGLTTADKPDSQDICFVPAGGYASVIERLRPEAAEPGDIVHVDGRVLGRHRGIVHFTIGQRRGLGLATGEPLFVVRLDAQRRKVVVGPRDCLRTRHILLRTVNWLGDEPLVDAARDGLEVHVRIRSTQAPRPAILRAVAEGCGEPAVSVRLEEAEHGVSPGQACVFYADAGARSRVLGGGWIASTEPGGARAATAGS
jgi:tRNA-specific 2-thiouridylase